MSPLTSVVYLVVGCAEWYLALRRTLACARGEKVLLVSIVFIENLLGLWVLSNFVRTNDWSLALSYSGGASAGALLVAMKTEEAQARPNRQPVLRSAHGARRKPLRLHRWVPRPSPRSRPRRKPADRQEHVPAPV
jgi:hypothetical protein